MGSLSLIVYKLGILVIGCVICYIINNFANKINNNIREITDN